MSKVVSGNPWLCGASGYEDILRQFDPGLVLPELRDPALMGRGSGTWNLNSYRSGELEGVPVFEKVYLANSSTWKRVAWAHEKILPQLRNKLKTPRLLQTVYGERLAVAYFEFVPDLRPIKETQLLDEALKFRRKVRTLYHDSVDGLFKQYSSAPLYRTGVAELRNIVAAAGGDAGVQKKIQTRISQVAVPRIFCHGDFCHKNVGVGGWIWDWDECGVYPDGYEIAAVLALVRSFENIAAFERFAKERITAECEHFWLCLFYFAAVFYSAQRLHIKVDREFILSLLGRAYYLADC